MPQALHIMTVPQAETLAALVRDGMRFSRVEVMPASGDAVLARDGDRLEIDPSGRVVYDSTGEDVDRLPVGGDTETIPTVVIAGRFPDGSKCTISCSPCVNLDVSSMPKSVARYTPSGGVRQGDRIWVDGQWLSVYRAAKHRVTVPV